MEILLSMQYGIVLHQIPFRIHTVSCFRLALYTFHQRGEFVVSRVASIRSQTDRSDSSENRPCPWAPSRSEMSSYGRIFDTGDPGRDDSSSSSYDRSADDVCSRVILCGSSPV